MLVAKFQTNDKPWSDLVLPQDWREEWRRRLRPFTGPFHKRVKDGHPPIDDFGPYRPRDEIIDRALNDMESGDEGDFVFVCNKAGKGARAQVREVDQPFGRVYHTIGPCKDDYDNMIVSRNLAGQPIKGQEAAILAFHEAERLNGRALRVTGYPFGGWRSCSVQSDLYRSDPGRFANPDSSRHCRGLAFDIENTPVNLTVKARNSLEAVGFCFGVSGEPWHCAFTECG